MILYYTSGETPSGKIESVWSPTMQEARNVERTMKADGLYFIETDKVHVPTDKINLLQWLNDHDVDIAVVENLPTKGDGDDF